MSDKLAKLPLPKGYLHGGSHKGITAELLDRHENLVVSTLKVGQETTKIVSWRLANHLKKMGAKWLPDPDFMNALAISAKCTVMLSAEYRQIIKVRSAGEISDEELLELMKPMLIAVLDAMSDEDFVKLLDERERVKRGECPVPSGEEEEAELLDEEPPSPTTEEAGDG